MQLNEKIEISFDQIKQLQGVEHVALAQRDGNPIQTSGWFTKTKSLKTKSYEIFNATSLASAIFNLGIHLHPQDLKYILIEGKKAKILIAPLNSPLHHSLNRILEQQVISDHNLEFFITIIAQPNTDVEGIFLQIGECLKDIKTTLITSGEIFKPPLIQFDEKVIQNIIKGFNVKENQNKIKGFDIKENFKLRSFSLNLSERISSELRKILNTFNTAISNLKYAIIAINGGFIASKINNTQEIMPYQIDNIAAMSDSLFQTADQYTWLFKKMSTDTIILNCDNTFQFIYRLGKVLCKKWFNLYELGEIVFITEISKSRQKLGSLRQIVHQISEKVNILINEIKLHNSNSLGELIIN